MCLWSHGRWELTHIHAESDYIITVLTLFTDRVELEGIAL